MARTLQKVHHAWHMYLNINFYVALFKTHCVCFYSRFPWKNLPDRMCYREPCTSDRDCCLRFNICDRSAHVCTDCWYGSSCMTDRDCCSKYPHCRPPQLSSDKNIGRCIGINWRSLVEGVDRCCCCCCDNNIVSQFVSLFMFDLRSRLESFLLACVGVASVVGRISGHVEF